MQQNTGQKYDELRQEIIERTVIRLVSVFDEGASKDKTSLWDYTADQHLERAEAHIKKLRAGDTSEDHIGHILWRTSVALMRIEENSEPSGEENLRRVCEKCGADLAKMDHSGATTDRHMAAAFHCDKCGSDFLFVEDK